MRLRQISAVALVLLLTAAGFVGRRALSEREAGKEAERRAEVAAAVLEELRKIEAAREIVQAFEAVGATRPVELADADKVVLFSLLEGWTRIDEMPEALDELRRRLSDDLADAG